MEMLVYWRQTPRTHYNTAVRCLLIASVLLLSVHAQIHASAVARGSELLRATPPSGTVANRTIDLRSQV